MEAHAAHFFQQQGQEIAMAQNKAPEAVAEAKSAEGMRIK
jgi:hypothetical protein